jgi:transposase
MGGIPNTRFLINERRKDVFFSLSRGLSESDIANELKVNRSTISRDIRAIQQECQKKIESIVQKSMPLEYEKCKTSMDSITKECWTIYQDKTGQWTNKNKIDALKLLKETNMTKLEILLIGPISLRAQQLEQKVRNLVEEDQKPQQNYFTVGLPGVIKHSNEDLK